MPLGQIDWEKSVLSTYILIKENLRWLDIKRLLIINYNYTMKKFTLQNEKIETKKKRLLILTLTSSTSGALLGELWPPGVGM